MAAEQLIQQKAEGRHWQTVGKPSDFKSGGFPQSANTVCTQDAILFISWNGHQVVIHYQLILTKQLTICTSCDINVFLSYKIIFNFHGIK